MDLFTLPFYTYTGWLLVGTACIGLVFYSFARHIILVLLFIEIFLLGVNLIFVIISLQLDDSFGFLAVFFILLIAAAETAIGLALVTLVFRVRRTIHLNHLILLKG